MELLEENGLFPPGISYFVIIFIKFLRILFFCSWYHLYHWDFNLIMYQKLAENFRASYDSISAKIYSIFSKQAKSYIESSWSSTKNDGNYEVSIHNFDWYFFFPKHSLFLV